MEGKEAGKNPAGQCPGQEAASPERDEVFFQRHIKHGLKEIVMNAEVQNIPVFFVTNTDMVGYTATTMVSVAVNTKHDVSFYIMDCGLSDFDRKQFQSLKDAFSNIKNIEFRSVDLKRFEGLSVWYHGLLDAWTMLLFPESFPEVNKGVHIESDTIVLDDIAKLYNVDLEGFTVAACPDIAATLRPEIDLDLHKHIYFNLGMIVIDFVKWRKENITEKSIALGKKYGKKFFCPIGKSALGGPNACRKEPPLLSTV